MASSPVEGRAASRRQQSRKVKRRTLKKWQARIIREQRLAGKRQSRAVG